MRIRPEEPSDFAAIGAVNRSAFPGEDEALLVERLRADGDLLASLVAECSEGIVGHVAFSKLRLLGEAGEEQAVALAPVAVLPARQNQGVGSALIRAGLELFRDRLVVVLGDTAYYPRFGFRPEHAAALRCAWSGPHLMATRPAAGELIYAGGFS